MSKPNPDRPHGTAPSPADSIRAERDPPGAYARRVQADLRVRCVHLLTKEAFVGIPSDHEHEFEADGPIWWCDETGTSLGPDSRACDGAACHGKAGRACYTPPAGPA